jgi:hypothetical protein
MILSLCDQKVAWWFHWEPTHCPYIGVSNTDLLILYSDILSSAGPSLFWRFSTEFLKSVYRSLYFEDFWLVLFQNVKQEILFLSDAAVGTPEQDSEPP